MKKHIFLSLLCSFCVMIFAQNGYNNIWVLGGSGWGSPKTDGNLLNFANSPLTVDSIKIAITMFDTNASISDSLGNLLFYSNGIQVANKNHEIMENGDSLSPCQLSIDNYDTGQNTPNGAIILPNPKYPNQYYLFHYNYIGLFQPPQAPFRGCSHLLCTTIDMSYNNGLGKVIGKNVPVISSPLTWGCIQAVKHANGRDWWIIIPEYKTAYYHCTLIDETGIHYLGKQLAGLPNSTVYDLDGGSLAKFSQQGDKYVRFAPGKELHIFDFDRCTGLLSNAQFLTLNLARGYGGVEFSPNGELLYVTNGDSIFQFNLNSINILTSKTLIGIYDTIFDNNMSPPGAYFFVAHLAPNGKIYIAATNGQSLLHVIENPNVLGIGCNFTQNGQILPNYNISVPNHPNYHLGAMVCDTTVGYPSEVSSERNKVYPNPAQDVLYIEMPISTQTTFVLYDIAGKEVLMQAFWGNSTKIVLGKLPKGAYFYHLFYNNKREYGKVLIE